MENTAVQSKYDWLQYDVYVYDSLIEFLKWENMTPEEWENNREENFIQNISCGTYNGALDIFDNWTYKTENGINWLNVYDTILHDINDTDFYNYGFSDVEDYKEKDWIELYVQLYKVVIIDNDIYIVTD